MPGWIEPLPLQHWSPRASPVLSQLCLPGEMHALSLPPLFLFALFNPEQIKLIQMKYLNELMNESSPLENSASILVL